MALYMLTCVRQSKRTLLSPKWVWKINWEGIKSTLQINRQRLREIKQITSIKKWSNADVVLLFYSPVISSKYLRENNIKFYIKFLKENKTI